MLRNIVGVKDSYLIDTSILVSALLEKEKEDKRNVAVKVVSNGINKACLCEQNLIEFVDALNLGQLDPKEQDEVKIIIHDFRSVYSILFPSKETLEHALLLSITKKISFDVAYIAQIMFENGIGTIYTEREKEFKKVPGIKAINPF